MESREPVPPKFDQPDHRRFEDFQLVSCDSSEAVWLAWDLELKSQVALRCLHEVSLSSWNVSAREKALRQWQAMPKVHSPRVERVFQVLRSESGYVLVTEPPYGEVLEQRLAHGPLSIEEACRTGTQVCEGLQVLHLAGVVYRGLSAKAVCLSAEGEVRLSTLPFAKAMDGIRGTGSMGVGKADHVERRALPPYCAPEMWTGSDATPRSDVYSVGCLLYRCLVGADPFDLPEQVAPSRDLRAVREDCPVSLAEVIRKCLAPAPQARFQTAESLRRAIEGVSTNGRRSRRELLLGGAGALLLASAGAWSLWGRGQRIDGSLSSGYVRRRALLIGIQDYGAVFQDLGNPVFDIVRLRDKLVAHGWLPEDITVLADPGETTALELKSSLERFECGPDDAVLIYYAGHGLADVGGEPALVARDANSESDAERMLRASHIAGITKPKHLFCVLDSCHSATMAQRLRDEWHNQRVRGGPLGRRPDSMQDVRTLHRGRWVLSSAIRSAGDESAKGSKVSPFCESLLGAMDSLLQESVGKGPFTVEQLCLSTKQRLAALGAGQTAHDEKVVEPEAQFLFGPTINR